jgi:TP901 family phage tail tape measure protein
MADVNANIGVNIDTSDALNQLKNLQRQISQFHQSVAKSSSTAAVAQRDLQKNFVNSVNAIQGFSAELRTVRTSAESFTNSLEKNKFSIQQYFRYAASQSKIFGKNFTAEFSAIEKTAIERVKTLQTQYVKMGRDAQGAMQAIAIRPTVLNMKDLGTQTAITAQKQVLFNQLVKQGSTNLLNFGKNTQWAGRQLMVGFTLPLATLGMTAGRVFMDMEKAAIKFKKVYGDLFTAPEETEEAMEAITELGLAYTKYGVAVSDSLNMASEAAAAGFQGVDLQNQTTAALNLSVLGQMEMQKALETTIALQNAFRISSTDLIGEIDFLNAVENQTVVSLDDITTAVPRVATVIQALGGDVRDLAFFLAAMKEGGVNAAQGANALKSGLASLINPTERASELLLGMGINIRGIVSQNAGDLRGTVISFARALDTLDPMRRAQAIEQLFGKFQFARISALFDNVIRDGSQASRVLDLAGSSLEDLADLSEKELGVSAASAMNKFRASIEQVKVALAPLGKLFLEIATPFIDFATTVLKAFNSLPDGIKKIIGTVITVVGGIGPILLMTFGLINNGIANMIKFFATVRLGYLKMTGQAKGIGDETQYMTQEQLEAAAAAASLDQAHAGLTQRFTAEKTAVDALRDAYSQAAAAGARFATLNPGMMKPGYVAAPTKMAKGGVVTVGGRGNKDTEPALLTPGEAVIPAPMVRQYGPLIEGMIAGNIPGYAKGVMLGMPKSAKSVSKGRDAAEEIYQMFLQSSYAGTAPTNYGHQISPTSGHSFPIFGLGGVYQKGNKQVFVKPVLDEKAALAEMRSTEISRRAHGLEAPEQKIVVIRDPMDTTRTRRFLALESDLDPKFVNNQPMGVFNEEQYFRQLVASLLRVDKDLSGSNVFGNVVADAGPAGVFNRASGLRNYEKNLPSMEDQALINLLGIKGGAKRAFAESTLGMMAGLTPEQYKARMLGEIQKVLPRLKETIASFKLTNSTEVGVYDDMVRRLEQGLGVDWSKFHAIHSAVKPAKPKAPTQAIPGYKNGVVSVPGPKGAGDVTPAMLSPGEAVIPTAMAKKYAPLISAMIAGNIPGYALGKQDQATFGKSGAVPLEASHLDKFAPKEFLNFIRELVQLQPELAGLQKEVFLLGEKAADGTREVRKVTMSLEEIANLPDTTELLSGGYAASGTTILETQQRNQSYDVAGFAGVPTSLAGVVEAGRLAEEALASGSNESIRWQEGLRQLVAEGQEAQAAQASSTAAQQDLDYTLKIAEKTYAEGLVSSGQEKDATKAATKAAERMTAIRTQYAEDLKSGLTEEQSLRRARIRALGAASLEAGTGELAAGPAGTGAQDLRQIASGRGGSSFRRVDMGADETRRFAARGLEPKALGVELYNAEFEKLGQEFTVESAKSFFAGAKQGLRIASPSQEIAEIAESVTDGVDSVKPEAEKAGKNLAKSTTQAMQNASGSAFGNINTKEPVPAVGNAPREVVSAMTQETTASRTFAESIKASFANIRTGISSAVNQIKQTFGIGGQELIQVAKNTNQGLVVNGKEYGFNAIAQAQGRDGAIEAVATRKTAELIANVTAAWNRGVREIPPIIPREMSKAAREIQASGERFKQISVDNEIKRQQAVQAVQQTLPTMGRGKRGMGAKLPKGAEGPLPQSSLSKAGESFDKISQNASNFALALSAVSGILSLMGGPLQGFAQGITLVTTGIFALIQIVGAVRALEIGLLVVKTKQLIADRLHLAMQAKDLALRKTKIIVDGVATAGTVGFGTAIWAAAAGVWAFLGPVLAIGLVVAALAATFMIANHVISENQKKINALGDAAFATGEKLKNIANLVGFEPTRGVDRSSQLESVKGMDAEGAARATSIRESDEFQELKNKESSEGGFKNDIAAIRDADPDQAQAALDSLALQLLSLAPEGTDPKKIQEYVAAIALEAGKGDLDLSFVLSVDLSDPATFSEIVQKSKTTLAELQAVSNRGETELKAYGSEASAAYEALHTGLKNGVLTTDQYTAQSRELLSGISTLGADATTVLDKMFANIGIPEEAIDGIDNLDAKVALLEASMAGVMGLEDIAKDLEEANGDAAEQQKILTDLEKKRAEAVLYTSETQERLKKVQEDINNQNQATALEEYLEKAREEAALKLQLEAQGYSAADAQLILSNEMLKGAYAAALAAGTLDEYNEQLAEFKSFEAAKVTSGGGGKSPFQEAIDKLKEQQKEAKNSIMTYAKLRSAGLSVSESSEIAKDSLLSAALAAEKVGSRRWNQLVAAIRAAREEEEAWLNSTPEGRAEQFEEVYSKVMDVFDSQEEILEMNNEAATASTRKIIETLEKQIEVYQRRSAELERDLDKIADKEDEINKAHDKRVKALETVKKINQDIANQQKSQISIADALSRGDISAAASAVEESRAQFAASQGDATQRGLEASRDAQINALTENGKTRVEIEAEIKRIKKEVETIEFGALQNAKDFVEEADEALETAVENLRIQGLTRDEWKNINTRIDASRANAALYDVAVGSALEKARNLVSEWEKLGKTYTTTHNIVTNSSGSRVTARGGGYISGPGTATSDSIPAMLSDGEYVIKAASVERFGTGFLDSVNSGQLPKFRGGGVVRDGGGSSRSTPAPVNRFSADSAERRAMAARPTTKAAAATSARIDQIQAEAAAQRQRDALYKKGGFQGFEAGLGSLMAAFGKSAPGKFLADSYSGTGLGNMAFRGALAILSTPGEIVGSLAKNAMDFIAKPNLQSLIKLNPLAAMNEGTANAFSGVLDASNTKASMFEQAAQTVIDNKMFGAGNAENDALARIIGGSLNILGDPTTYIGVGAVKAGIKAGVRAGAKTTAPSAAGQLSQESLTVSQALTGPRMFEGIKGILPAIKGTGVNKVDGRPLSNPNLSLAKSTFFRQNLHGSQAGLVSKPKPFDVDPNRKNPDNWFGADFFTTTSKKLASSYGGGSLFSAKMPITQALKLKILDLYPGAPPIGVQFPGLANKLFNSGHMERLEPDSLISPNEISQLKAYLNNPARHTLIANDKNTSQILYEHGIRGIRHQSGHGGFANTPVHGEVFALIRPENTRAIPKMDFSGVRANIVSRRRSNPLNYSGSLRPETIRERFNLFKRYNFDLKKYNPFTNKFDDSMETWMNTLAEGGLVKRYAKGGLSTNKFAMGGLVSPKYFAKGGLVTNKFAMGGLVSPKYFAEGGMAQGTDTIPAMLSPGEFVVNKKSTDLYGPLLAAMNSSPAASLHALGEKSYSQPVYNIPSKEYSGAGGSLGLNSTSNNLSSLTALDNSVYNYSLSVNVEGTNASANDIANVVMNKIKSIESQQVRRQVIK